jgi:hypothetical protein
MKLRRAINLTLLCTAIGTAVFVFNGKKSAEREAEAIARLNGKIATEKQRISELRAEWSMLDDPARLQALVKRHSGVLNLEPIGAKQIGALEDIPLRIPVRGAIGEAADGRTGGIGGTGGTGGTGGGR